MATARPNFGKRATSKMRRRKTVARAALVAGKAATLTRERQLCVSSFTQTFGIQKLIWIAWPNGCMSFSGVDVTHKASAGVGTTSVIPLPYGLGTY